VFTGSAGTLLTACASGQTSRVIHDGRKTATSWWGKINGGLERREMAALVTSLAVERATLWPGG
jgi:hypothetical protein